VWTIDFKGQFRTGNGQYCYPLTVMDQASRYLLGCQAMAATTIALSQRTMERIFAEHGLPAVIRSDNGSPFAAANSAIGLTALGVWWIELGISHERIQPGCPEQNGAHERFHRTLKRETARPPAHDGRAQQRRFGRFRHEYNHERPHQTLGGAPPASLWHPSPRSYPGQVAEPDYPGHWLVRRVDHGGHFKLRSRTLFLSNPLRHKLIGLEEVGDGLWAIHFHHVELARFDERDSVLHV
jgi:transposase InsO family protein